MPVGVIRDANTLAALGSRIAQANAGSGLPLDLARQLWTRNALVRENDNWWSSVANGLLISTAAYLLVRELLKSRAYYKRTAPTDNPLQPPPTSNRAEQSATAETRSELISLTA